MPIAPRSSARPRVAVAAPKKATEQKSKTATPTPRKGGGISLRPSARVAWFFAAVTLFVLATSIALKQEPRPDVYGASDRIDARRLLYPTERNPAQRLPALPTDLTDVYVLPGSKRIWVVGNSGFVAASRDGGRRWTQDTALVRVLRDPETQGENAAPATVAMVARTGSRATTPGVKSLRLSLVEPAQAQSSPAQQSVQGPPRGDYRARDLERIDTLQVEQLDLDAAKQDPSISQEALRGEEETAPVPDLLAVWFANRNRGWAVGTAGTLVSTDDGGRTWIREPIRSVGDLRDVYFAETETGWILGENGLLVRTTDGGLNWDEWGNVGSDVEAVHFVDVRTGVAVGAGGVFKTTDGGLNWTRVWEMPAAIGGRLLDVRFVDQDVGWAVGEPGYVLKTVDAGTSWSVQPLSIGIDSSLVALHSVRFDDALVGRLAGRIGDRAVVFESADGGVTWRLAYGGAPGLISALEVTADGRALAVGASGLLLHETPAGWELLGRPADEELVDIHFVTSRRGWAVGGFASDEKGVLYQSSNGGATWERRVVSDSTLFDAHFIDDRTGWAVGDHGTLLKTADGGRRWRALSPPEGETFVEVFFATGDSGWALSESLRLYASSDGGHAWSPVAATRGDRLALAAFPVAEMAPPRVRTAFQLSFLGDRSTGWLVTPSGVMKTDDGGQTWLEAYEELEPAPQGVHFLDGVTGWIVAGGQLHKTANRGLSWQPQLTADSPVRNIHFRNARTGWASGPWGTLLKTTDGGQSWFDPRPYGFWPAPWYFLSLVLVGFLLVPALKRPHPTDAPEASVADVLVSDRPLRPGDYDALDLGSIATGLSRFIRNENTQPPLTVAVTGAWGSGKSSLMNLLQGDLRRYGFRPVWFNAWHHQKEESLLAALLEGIRGQAIPPLWHPVGLNFRMKLLAIRTRKHLPILIGASVSLAVLSAYFIQRPDHLATGVVWADGVLSSVIKFLGGDGSAEVPTTAGDGSTDTAERSFISVVLPPALVALFLFVWRAMIAFGVKPSVLLGNLKRNVRARDLQAKTSFRYQFARQFEEVTHALAPRTMVVMIDDLDRCRPENVMEILEAVNFLVSSGECFIILGMELDRVEQYVSHYFEQIEEPDFARKYLEKMINIEVPIPAPDEAQSEMLIVPHPSELRQNGRDRPPISPQDIASRVQRVYRYASASAAVLLPFVAFAVTLWFTDPLPAPTGSAPGVATVLPGTSDEGHTNAGDETAPSGVSIIGTVNAPAAADQRPVRLRQGTAPSMPFSLFGVPMAILMLLGLWRLSIPPDVVVRDSPSFATALKVWHDVIMTRSRTPRSAKRFVNRVRYYAMQQRVQPSPVTASERVASWIEALRQGESTPWKRLAPGGRNRTSAEAERWPPEAIPQEMLVALCALYHHDPARFESASMATADDLQLVGGEDRSLLAKTISEHVAEFGEWQPRSEHVRRLRKMMGSVDVR